MQVTNIPAVTGKTKIFAILGYPLGHTMSPLIHNAAFRDKKIDSLFIALPVQKADEALKKAILTLNISGCSVTIPHKSWAAKIAKRKDELSEKCGAANTLIREKDGTLSAYNTDGPGAIRAMKRSLPNIIGKKILLIGYGGSASAIAHTLMMQTKPKLLAIAGRNKKKQKAFIDELRRKHTAFKKLIQPCDYTNINPEDIDIIIHTTPLGMKGQETTLPLPESFVQKHHAVFDIVYNPPMTPLLKLAKKRGAKIIPGYLMFLYQALLQFELFTNQTAPKSIMEKELLDAIRKLL